MNISKNDLVSCIDQFISEKKMGNPEMQKPATIKKKELETHLDEFALEHEINYQKKSQPSKTIYSFSLEGNNVDVEFFYRYSNFYTRHSITLK